MTANIEIVKDGYGHQWKVILTRRHQWPNKLCTYTDHSNEGFETEEEAMKDALTFVSQCLEGQATTATFKIEDEA